MSWLYSRALVEEYLRDICLDGEQSVQSSGSNTQQAYCAPDKMTGFSRLSRYGMTYKPLMENLGEELLTLYLGDFHAKTSAQQEKAQELMENDQECGEKWRGSFTKYDPNSSLWKTHQCSLLGDLEEFSETWPKWGLMRDGECWEQLTLERTIRGTEFGLLEQTWPTPRSCTAMAAKITPESVWNEKRNSNLETVVGKTMWPTPIASRGGAWRSDGQVSMIARNVETYEEYWLLTQGTSKKKREKYWPTPTCQDADKATKQFRENHQNNLTAMVFNSEKMFPTPTTRDYKGGYKTESLIRKDGKSRALDALPNAVLDGKGTETATGQLNPTWVEWLMGWPLGWTDLNPLEMDKSLCVQQQHGNF